MNHSIKTGLSFGLTSGVVTTLGLLIGLSSGTESRLAVIGGILTIAVADALSDALGIHISEESENQHTPAEIWLSTLSTLVGKIIFALSFVIPVVLLPLYQAVIASVVWGALVLAFFSYCLAKRQKMSPVGVVLEHLTVLGIVVVASHIVGSTISRYFN
ncbi:MAG: VIT1/CCC1 transporter family protein [Patescibacteria group bacterium]|jgi:VIT1/CCC1 family predicted Fe2+/Mn2+ transporter